MSTCVSSKYKIGMLYNAAHNPVGTFCHLHQQVSWLFINACHTFPSIDSGYCELLRITVAGTAVTFHHTSLLSSCYATLMLILLSYIISPYRDARVHVDQAFHKPAPCAQNPTRHPRI